MAIKITNPTPAPASIAIGNSSFFSLVVFDPSETDSSATGAGSDSPSIATVVSTPDSAAMALN